MSEEKIVLVTGVTSGIGFYTARALVQQGARVYVTGRDVKRGREAVAQLRQIGKHDQAHFIAADMSTVGENRRLARALVRRTGRLDVLINDVGGIYSRRWETADGYEATLAVNALGPYVLTWELLPLLRRSSAARIVNVVSSAHFMWKRHLFDDLQLQERYVGIKD